MALLDNDINLYPLSLKPYKFGMANTLLDIESISIHANMNRARNVNHRTDMTF